MHSPTATKAVARRPEEEDQSDQQVVLDAASFLTAMRNTNSSNHITSSTTSTNQLNPKTTSATRTSSSCPHHFSTNEDAAGHPFKNTDKAKIIHQNSTSAPQTQYDLVPTNAKSLIRKLGPHQQQQHHQEEQILYYDSSSAETRRGKHPKTNKITFSSSIRTARNWEQQVAPMPVPRQPSMLQDSDAAMKAAQSLYYQHMIDAHARHQYGHFAMMSMQHQAPTVSIKTHALPSPPHRLQPQQARPPPHRLQPQQQHSGLVGNTRKRHLPSIPINPAAASNDTPRVGSSNFYLAREMQGSGGMANNNFTSKHAKIQHTHHYPRPESNTTTATNSETCTSPSANSSTTGVDSAFVHARLSPPKSHKNGTTVPNSTRGGAESNVPATRFVDGSNVQQLRHLLTPQDRHLTTHFTVSIIDQLDFVYFEEGDRRSHRTHLPIGFRGICCRHCKAAPGKSGRFFPSSLKTLSDTQKTLYTLHRHFIKCKQTPKNVQEMLHKQRMNHLEERKTRKCHGSQRAFFRRIWGFLCPEAEGDSIASCAIDKTKEDKEAKA